MASLTGLRAFTHEVIPGLHQITVRYANMFLIVEKSLTLIDTGFGGTAPYIVNCIKKFGRSPEEIGLVVLTHNHLDHTGSLGDLRKVAQFKVAAHAADLYFPGNVLPYPHGDLLGRVLKIRPFTGFRKRLLLDGTGVDIILHGGEQFDVLGGMTIVNTPGHTPGSISLHFPAHKLLVAGDAVNKKGSILRLPLKTASTRLPEAARSIRTMAALDVQVLCFGHGRPITVNAQATLQSLVSRLPG